MRRILVGSAVSSMLAGLGITPETVSHWFSVDDCGCDRRRELLDKWGIEKQEKLTRLLAKAGRHFQRQARRRALISRHRQDTL